MPSRDATTQGGGYAPAAAPWVPAQGLPLTVSSIHPKGHAALSRGSPPWLGKVQDPNSPCGRRKACATCHRTLLTFLGKAWKGASGCPRPGPPGAPWRHRFLLSGSALGAASLPDSGVCLRHPRLACRLLGDEGQLRDSSILSARFHSLPRQLM